MPIDEFFGGLLFIGALLFIMWCAIMLIRSMFLESEPAKTLTQTEMKVFPKAPELMAALSVSVIEREFSYLTGLLANFQPANQKGAYGRDQDGNGTADYDSAIYPFKEHIMAAVNAHNSAVAKHNEAISKFTNEAMQYAVDLERRVKKV